jgi:hypothetical protein
MGRQADQGRTLTHALVMPTHEPGRQPLRVVPGHRGGVLGLRLANLFFQVSDLLISLRRVNRLCLSEPLSQPFDVLGDVLVSLAHRLHRRSGVRYIDTGSRKPMARPLREEGPIRPDHGDDRAAQAGQTRSLARFAGDQGSMKSLLLALATLFLIVGCETRQEEALPTGSRLPDGAATYTTGEKHLDWPSYDLPVDIQIEVPEIPEGIVGPSPEIPPEEDHDQD